MTGSVTELVLAGMTERGASRAPLHLALVSGDNRLDYAVLHAAVLRCVAALRASGIGKGDRIAYLGLNSIDYVILLQAALRIGAVTVAINWRLVAREIAFIVADARIALLVTELERLDAIGDDERDLAVSRMDRAV
jgi:acyl-CoA synthetase (AMP-forming)/AMP-acid ligase II